MQVICLSLPFNGKKIFKDYDIFLRFEFRNCHLITSEWLAMFFRIMGRLAPCILSVWWSWSRVVCVLVDIYIRYSFATHEH